MESINQQDGECNVTSTPQIINNLYFSTSKYTNLDNRIFIIAIKIIM